MSHLRGEMSKKAGRNNEVDAGTVWDSSSDDFCVSLNKMKFGRKIDGCCDGGGG